MDADSLGVHPRWTEQLYPPSAGLDHLGLRSVITGTVLDALSPRVVVVTVHPRYWSFYTWLLWRFWQTNRPKTRKGYSQFHRPREAIFAAGAAGGLCPHPEHRTLSGGVIGSDTAAPHASTADICDATINYLQHSTGGYGAQYSGTIARTGLTLVAAPEAGLPWDGPTPAGIAVAEAFQTAVERTHYYRDYFDDDAAQVPREIVGEYIERACLCQLRVDTAPERDLLRKAFLSGGDELEAQAQRDTFRLVLDIADQTAGDPVGEEQFRQLVYFRASETHPRFDPLDATVDAARRWRIYQSREYYNFALTRMWQWVVTHGLAVSNNGLQSIPQAEILNVAVAALDQPSLARHFNFEAAGLDSVSTITAWQGWLTAQANIDGKSLDQPWDVTAPVQEHTLFRYADQLDPDDPRCLPACLAILALIAARFGSQETEMRYRPDWALLRAGGSFRLALSRFLNQWRARQRAADTAADVLRWLLDDYVIRQHVRVATAKLPGTYTFRFTREGDRLRFNDLPATARMNGSRFNSISTVLHELGFVGPLASDHHALTAAGYNLLEHGGPAVPPATGHTP